MALRLIRASSKFQYILRTGSVLRTPKDVRRFSNISKEFFSCLGSLHSVPRHMRNLTNIRNEYVKCLSALMSQPPKGFGKFQRKDKQPKSEQPKVESPNREEEPSTKKESDSTSKSDGQKNPQMPNADFFEKLSKEFGGGGSGGGGNNNINMQQAGAALVAMGVLYYLYQNVSI